MPPVASGRQTWIEAGTARSDEPAAANPHGAGVYEQPPPVTDRELQPQGRFERVQRGGQVVELAPGDSEPAGSPAVKATMLGVLALVFWASTIGVSRELSAELGTLTAAATVFLVSGVLASLALALRPAHRHALRQLPRAYWLACGPLFVTYMVSLYLAIGLAPDADRVVQVGMINYLWPGLTLLFSWPLLGQRPSWRIAPGILLATSGVLVALSTGSSRPSPPRTPGDLEQVAPYFFALVAAISWSIYNNLTRRLAPRGDGSGVPLFLLASGLVLGVMRLVRPETSCLSARGAIHLAYMCVFPTVLAYTFWEHAMRRGRVALLLSLSYLTPLASTVISCWLLGVPFGSRLGLAAALVIAGAALCERAFRQTP